MFFLKSSSSMLALLIVAVSLACPNVTCAFIAAEAGHATEAPADAGHGCCNGGEAGEIPEESPANPESDCEGCVFAAGQVDKPNGSLGLSVPLPAAGVASIVEIFSAGRPTDSVAPPGASAFQNSFPPGLEGCARRCVFLN